jgi:hypothetical protein
VWDTQAPQPAISTVGKYATTDERRIPLLIDFGERVLQLNPLRLFTAEGFTRCAADATMCCLQTASHLPSNPFHPPCTHPFHHLVLLCTAAWM